MKLNGVEFFLMNNPVRRLIQKTYEFHSMGLAGVDLTEKSVLEIGCGSGYGTHLVLRNCQPDFIQAIDLDERMIKLAQTHRSHPKIRYNVMDASNMDYSDHAFDAIVDFGIIHHIPNWQDCIKELRRVLKPGGMLFMEELTVESFETVVGKLWKTLLDHPYAQMFNQAEMIESLKENRFTILKINSFNPFGILRHFNLIATAH